MSGAVVETFPDETGCTHTGLGLSSPTRKLENAEVGWCFDCKCEIVFFLDQSGKRTGKTRIVQVREVGDSK